MGRLRAQRGGAKKEGEDEEEALGLPVYALTSAPFVRQFSQPSAVVVLHGSSWSSHDCSHHHDGDDDVDNREDDDQDEEAMEHPHDHEELDHPCLQWSGMAKEYFGSITAGEVPSWFLLDCTRLEEREAAELATPLGTLGPISKPIGRLVSRINPEKSLFVAKNKGCSVLLKLLIESELTTSTSSQSIWKRPSTEFLLVAPHVPHSFARRMLSRRFPNASASSKRKAIIVVDPSDRDENHDAEVEDQGKERKGDDTGIDRLTHEELAAACRQTNLFSQIEIISSRKAILSATGEGEDESFHATKLASIISSRSSVDDHQKNEEEGEGVGLSSSSPESTVLFASEVLWQQNSFSKQMEQKSIDITYQLFAT